MNGKKKEKKKTHLAEEWRVEAMKIFGELRLWDLERRLWDGKVIMELKLRAILVSFLLSQLLPCLFISRIQRALLNCYSVGCYSVFFQLYIQPLGGREGESNTKRREERDSRAQPNDEMSGERNGKVIGKVGLLSIRTSPFPPNYVTATLVSSLHFVGGVDPGNF